MKGAKQRKKVLKNLVLKQNKTLSETDDKNTKVATAYFKQNKIGHPKDIIRNNRKLVKH